MNRNHFHKYSNINHVNVYNLSTKSPAILTFYQRFYKYFSGSTDEIEQLKQIHLDIAQVNKIIKRKKRKRKKRKYCSQPPKKKIKIKKSKLARRLKNWRKNINVEFYSKNICPPCWLCGEPIEKSDLSLDHAIPISEGGDIYNPNNFEPAHRKCNNERRRNFKETLTDLYLKSLLVKQSLQKA